MLCVTAEEIAGIVVLVRSPGHCSISQLQPIEIDIAAAWPPDLRFEVSFDVALDWLQKLFLLGEVEGEFLQLGHSWKSEVHCRYVKAQDL